ncbi:hypothetical protein D3C75_399950 [compost metagenome]
MRRQIASIRRLIAALSSCSISCLSEAYSSASNMSLWGKVMRKTGSSGMLLQSISVPSTYSLVRNGMTLATTVMASCNAGVSLCQYGVSRMVREL